MAKTKVIGGKTVANLPTRGTATMRASTTRNRNVLPSSKARR